MVDLVQTAANVLYVSGPRPAVVKGGEAITRGMPVYKLASDGEHYKGDADTDAASDIEGVALSDGNNGGDMLMAVPGSIVNIGATTTAGTIYVLSTTAGGIAPWADLGANDYVVVLFIGTGTAEVELICKKGSAVHA